MKSALLILGLCRMAIAAVNKTVDWDNLDGFLRYMPNSSVWFSESAGLSKDPDYAFSNFTDASVLFQFSGNALHYLAPLWPFDVEVLVSISAVVNANQVNVTKVSLFDTSVPAISNPPDIGNGDFSKPLGLRQSWSLPGHGWWTVIVEAAPGSIGLAAMGTFVYTQLNAIELAALSPALVLPQTTVTVTALAAPPTQAENAFAPRNSNTTGIVVGTVMGGLGLIAIIGAFLYLRRRRLRRVKFIIDADDEGPTFVPKTERLTSGKSEWHDSTPVPFILDSSTDSSRSSLSDRSDSTIRDSGPVPEDVSEHAALLDESSIESESSHQSAPHAKRLKMIDRGFHHGDEKSF